MFTIRKIDVEKILSELKGQMKPKRFQHTLGVIQAARDLAQKFEVDVGKAQLAALLHDCAKCMDGNRLIKMAEEYGIEIDMVDREVPAMLHAPVGAELAKRKYGINDEDVLQAIASHTVGSENMTALDKVVILADTIESGRRTKNAILLREMISEGTSLDEATICCIDFKIKFVIKSKGLLHPKAVSTRNALLLKIQK